MGRVLAAQLLEMREVPRSQPGDIWALGPHKLVCGSALDPVVVSALMGGERAQMVFTDPPYNVPIDGHVGGLGKTKHREFAMAAGEMSPAEFIRFLRTAFENLTAHSIDGAIITFAWTGAIWPRSSLPATASTPSSRT
jgi:hypothetical protein